jgi:ferredoxin
MNFSVRDGKFDVVIVAGPRLENWPSVGVRTISIYSAEMGLTVGQYGGEHVTVRGVIPLPGTGGIVLVEDIQKRIHRIRARAIVRMSPPPTLPDPFPGWRSQGLIPLSTAILLKKEAQVKWDAPVAILGTGNRALRFGSHLLETGTSSVYCIETSTQWGAKRFAGWEVERRRFEMSGGKLLEARPIQLLPKGPLLWSLRLQDVQGVRILTVGRVVSIGPFQNSQGVREYPPGSLLFDLEQSAAPTLTDDTEGWALEEERGKWLAGKIVKTLVNELGPKRETIAPMFRNAKLRLKRYLKHREEPFTPSYQGKWMNGSDSKKIRTFQGVPQHEHKNRPIASVECIEEIPCNICQTVCPTSAIQLGTPPTTRQPKLNEDACTACGLCVAACPSNSIPLIQDQDGGSTSPLTLAWRGVRPWSAGEYASLVNRRGETLGSARITAVSQIPNYEGVQLVRVEAPAHLIWEARGLKKSKTAQDPEDPYHYSLRASQSHQEKVEITLNSERRLVRDRIPISLALFEIGQSRPEDILLCKDGSCGMCHISVDGSNKPACQTKIHRGMAIRVPKASEPSSTTQMLCPCLSITKEQVIERLKQGKLQSPEAVLSITHVGEGKCHGQLCMDAFKRVLLDQGLDLSQWIDWRFPWSDWILTPHS